MRSSCSPPTPRRRSRRSQPSGSEAAQWFQLYLSDRTIAECLIDRVAAAGFTALVLTADMPVYGSSPRAAREPLIPSAAIRNVNLPGAPIARNAYDGTFSGSVTYPVTLRISNGWRAARRST